MAFRGFFADEESIYAIDDDGDLRWFREEEGAADELTWAPGSGKRIGLGWDFAHVFAGGRGVIYAIRETGELLWYRDDFRDGTNGRFAENGWAPGSSNQIGHGWSFAHVISGGGGVIYAIRQPGEVLWYHDLVRDGTNNADTGHGWDLRGSVQIGKGWDFARVFPGRDGVVYGIRSTGELVWHRDEVRDGTNDPESGKGWARDSGTVISAGWQEVSSAFARGRFIYGVGPDGSLFRVEAEARGGRPKAAGQLPSAD